MALDRRSQYQIHLRYVLFEDMIRSETSDALIYVGVIIIFGSTVLRIFVTATDFFVINMFNFTKHEYIFIVMFVGIYLK